MTKNRKAKRAVREQMSLTGAKFTTTARSLNAAPEESAPSTTAEMLGFGFGKNPLVLPGGLMVSTDRVDGWSDLGDLLVWLCTVADLGQVDGDLFNATCAEPLEVTLAPENACPLTLVTGPAGSGKTVPAYQLMREFLSTRVDAHVLLVDAIGAPSPWQPDDPRLTVVNDQEGAVDALREFAAAPAPYGSRMVVLDHLFFGDGRVGANDAIIDEVERLLRTARSHGTSVVIVASTWDEDLLGRVGHLASTWIHMGLWLRANSAAEASLLARYNRMRKEDSDAVTRLLTSDFGHRTGRALMIRPGRPLAVAQVPAPVMS